MDELDLSKVYQLVVEDLVAEKTKSDKYLHDAFDYSSEAHLQADNGKTILFTRCYELTMTYLAALRDIDEKYYDRSQDDFSNQKRQELKKNAEELKNAGAMMFNGMVQSGMYFNQPNARAFFDFWNAFYNGEPYNAFAVTKQLEQDVKDAQKIFKLTSQEKFTSKTLGDACLKFANANEFAKMVRLALSVDRQDIQQYGKFISGLEENISIAKQQCAVDSKTIDRGFVTELAFALDSSKNQTRNIKIRDKQAESIQRFILSTYGISNKVAKEYNHVGVGNLKICTVVQQRTYGANPKHENWMDFMRGFYGGCAAGAKVLGDMKTVLGFAFNQGDAQKNKEDMEKLIDRFTKALKEKMPQEVLGQPKDQMELKDVTLAMLLFDAKLENHNISDSELQQRSLIRDAVEHAMEEAKECVKDMMKEKEEPQWMSTDQKKAAEVKETLGEIKELADDGAKYGAELFDRLRYDNLEGAEECYGERGMATLRLVTHLMSHGEQEHTNNLLVYNDAINYLHDTFKERLFEKEMEEEYVEEFGDRV